MFLGTKNKVYILDKSENNPTTIDGKYGSHPAWAVEYDIKTQQGESCPVRTKSFTCSYYDCLNDAIEIESAWNARWSSGALGLVRSYPSLFLGPRD